MDNEKRRFLAGRPAQPSATGLPGDGSAEPGLEQTRLRVLGVQVRTRPHQLWGLLSPIRELENEKRLWLQRRLVGTGLLGHLGQKDQLLAAPQRQEELPDRWTDLLKISKKEWHNALCKALGVLRCDPVSMQVSVRSNTHI